MKWLKIATIEQLRVENQLLRENMEQSTTLSPSLVCAKYYIQNCHACDRADCGDNQTPSIVALKTELAKEREAWKQEQRALLLAMRAHRDCCRGFCPWNRRGIKRACPTGVTIDLCDACAADYFQTKAQIVVGD